MKHLFTAEKEYARLSGLISDQIAFLPLSVIKKQIQKGEVRVNGKKVLSDAPLSAGDELKLFLPKALEPKSPLIETVYTDEHVLVVAKPVLCETETHLTELVKNEYGFAVPVHRLDRNTAGLVLFARSAKVESELKRLMKAHKIEKTYCALIYGTITPAERSVRVFLKKDSVSSTVQISDLPRQGYLTAELVYNTVGKVGEDTIVDIRLITGRTHQIRATMAHLGHPVIGDGKYGIESVNRARRANYQKLFAFKLNFCFDASESTLLSSLSKREILWKNYEFYKNM